MDGTINIPHKIFYKINKELHLSPNHPICIIKDLIYAFFDEQYPGFKKFDEQEQVVTVEDNFDKLLIPADHPARSLSDTYYIDETHVLRTHTSAHQNELLSKGYEKFLVTGDVFRKDEVDATHYPVFHQMEGVCLMKDGKDPEVELKKVLTGLVETLFPGCDYDLHGDYFPFTDPSFEVEVDYNGKLIEILGCGVIQTKILENCGFEGRTGWAFGLGLERLAMILFEIPDIRYFWTTDDKFLSQFKQGEITKFKPYSQLDPRFKDVSFWINSEEFIPDPEGSGKLVWSKANNFYELCRDVCGDFLAEVILHDEFRHPDTGRYSHCYRLKYQPVDTSMKDPGQFNMLVNGYHNLIGKGIPELGVELR